MKLDERSRELIAIGASVTANCQPCLEYHVSKALENGAESAEILEAVEVGKMVRKGAGSKMDKFALNLVQTPVSATVSATSATDAECGCRS